MKFNLIGSFWLTTLLLLVFLIPKNGLIAQPLTGENRWTVSGAYSSNSVELLGKTGNSQTQMFSFGFQRSFIEYSPTKHLWYTAEFIPYIHYSYPKRDENNRRVNRSGFGISPIGLLLTNTRSKWISPNFQITGGVVIMEDNFPTNQSQSLNYTFDITIANRFTINELIHISAGYKFHHISNAETGLQNPGLDSNFLFLTLSVQ